MDEYDDVPRLEEYPLEIPEVRECDICTKTLKFNELEICDKCVVTFID